MGDHTETIQIDFDPHRIDFAALLSQFWQGHNPGASRPTQYKSVIFYHDDNQLRLAEASRDREALRRQTTLHTEILPFQTFYRAEDYHQKYYLRRERDLWRQLRQYYTDDRGLTDATAAARINGFLGGFGTPDALAAQGSQLGLSAKGLHRLQERLERRRP